MKKTALISALKSGVAPAFMGLALVASPAMAQEVQEEPQADDIADAEGDAIVVTGTRINNPNLEQTSPVAVVTAEQIELRQANVVEEFLREIPGVVPSIGQNVNNGNGGSTFVNLRGIGANRNLALINGTRVVPAGLAGITNLDVVPVALIERVDVLTGGAGAVYGADAIAGVVNFITREDFSGFDLNISNGITEEGDGNTFRADLTIGANFDDGRGNAVLSVGYTDRNPVFQGARPFGLNNISSVSGNPGGSSTTVPSVVNAPSIVGADGVPIATGAILVGTDPDTGDEFSILPQIQPGGGLDGFNSPFNFNPFNLFQTPLEQFRIYGSARYELTDTIEAFGEALFNQSTASTIIAPSGTFRNVLTTPLSNPFLPTGIRNQICGADTMLFSAAVADDPTTPQDESSPQVSAPGLIEPLFSQAECDAAALATDPNDPNFRTADIDFGRRFVELGTRNNERQTRLFQIKAGLRGDLASNLKWELFGSYGESDLRSQQSGNGTITRLQQSLLSTNPNECLDPSNGCVPIDLFGPVGSISPGVANFLDVGNSASTFTSLAQVQGFVNGDFGLTLPWASQPVGIVIGGEYREYTAGTASDLLTQTPGEVLGNGAAAPDAFGTYNVYEAFGELSIPIASDQPFFNDLTLSLGGRISEYSSTGTEFTYNVGGNWSPVEGLNLRGTYSRVTRAPNIGELFAPQVTGLDNFDFDPCAGGAPVGNADLAAVCLAQGAPQASIGGIQVDPAGQVNVTGGGNPNLAAEDADTFTIGAIIQPAAIPGLSVTVDYYNISISGAISTPTTGDIFNACFGTANANDPLAITAASATDPACTSIRRNPATGNLFGNVGTTPGLPQVLSNLGEIGTDGIDLVVNYRRDFDFATLNLNFNGNWTNSSTFQATPSAIDRECVNFFSVNCGSIQPEFSFSQRSTLSFDDVDVSLFWRWINGVEVEPLVQGNFLPEFETIDAEHYFDLTVRWKVVENFQFTAAVINLFDNDPTVVGSNIGATAFNSGNTFPSTYDPLGRRVSISARITF